MALSTTQIVAPTSATQSEIDSLTNLEPGTRIFNTTTSSWNVSRLGGATPVFEEEVISESSDIIIEGITYSTPINSITDTDLFSAHAIQSYNESFIASGRMIFARGRGDKTAPTALQTGDLVGGFSFSGISTSGTLFSGVEFNVAVDGVVSTTQTPMGCTLTAKNTDNNTQSLIQLGSDGKTLMQNVGSTAEFKIESPEFIVASDFFNYDPTLGTGKFTVTADDFMYFLAANKITLDSDTVNLVTENFQINGVDPFAGLPTPTMQQVYDEGSVVNQALGQKVEFVFSDENAVQFEFSSAQAGTGTPLRADQSGINSSWYSEWEWTHIGKQFFENGFNGFVELGSFSSVSRTLTANDFSVRITPTNASPITLTLPASSVSNVGGTCYISQGNIGSITVQAPAGVELNGVDGGSFVIDNPSSITELIYYDGSAPDRYLISPTHAAKCYGGMYFKNNDTITTIVTDNAPVKVNATYVSTAVQSNLSSDAAGTLTVGLIQPGDYIVECHVDPRAGGSIRNDYTFYLRQNGVNNTESSIRVSLDNNDTHVRYPTLEFLTNVSTGDTFELWVENNDSNQDVEVDSIYYTLKKA